MTDSENLRLIANFFDIVDEATHTNTHDVQDFLRELADRLERLENVCADTPEAPVSCQAAS